MIVGPALIDGGTFTRAHGPGLRVARNASDVTIRNATVCGNSGVGIASHGNGVLAVNNMISGNGGAGVSVRLRSAMRATALLNNTVVANGRQGLIVRERGRRSRTLIYNNVVSGNEGVGIGARAVRGTAAFMGSNLNTDGYERGTRQGAGDLNVSPQFAGGAPSAAVGCEDLDAYRLAMTSAAIDAGVRTPAELGIGNRTATIDGAPDAGATDLGFHYRQ
jgi:hypothetical protein